jgi:hypothetical protein
MQVMKEIIKITLELNAGAVQRIEDLTDCNIKQLLEMEINKTTDAFIERMGYDNY